ncbi:proteasome-type protease [Verticiella sediminum]|uniref:proteasome-type protease n=1 Tax=Verticiella sediminum TaxID=1247510 RepID=UPI001FE53FC0|nr:proteasome-type protease [Verticiella sediminum]
MTYCVAVRPDAGLVFLSDSRTNAGVDQISTFRKMTVFEHPGERVMVLMTAGNLAISQAVRSLLTEGVDDARNLWTVSSMFEAAQVVGEAVRAVYQREADTLREHDVHFNISLILGGQIGTERCRLFQIYSAGNFIEATDENVYFQIGESKYGKPILDRVLDRHISLDAAAKCALVSMDSTLRSNISVGLPLDLLVYEANSLHVTRFASLDEHNQYFRMLSRSWSERLRDAFEHMPDPTWVPVEGEEAPITRVTANHEAELAVRATSSARQDSGRIQTLAEGLPQKTPS